LREEVGDGSFKKLMRKRLKWVGRVARMGREEKESKGKGSRCP